MKASMCSLSRSTDVKEAAAVTFPVATSKAANSVNPLAATIQHHQNAFAGLDGVLRHRTRSRLVAQTGQSLPTEPATPQADRPRHCVQCPGDRPRRASFGRQQDDQRAKNVALFRRGGSHPCLKHRTICRRQPDFRSFGNHPNVES
jgi:hypothetical protein